MKIALVQQGDEPETRVALALRDPNFTANVGSGGPSHLDAIACHYLDLALMCVSSLGIEIVEPGAPPPNEGSIMARLLARVRETRTRREIGCFLLAGPIGLGSALIAGGTLYLIGCAITELLFIPSGPTRCTAPGAAVCPALFVQCASGVIALVAEPTVIERTSYAQGRLVQRCLGA